MDLSNISIDEIDLSVRSTNALKRAKVFTVSDMVKLNEEDLSNIRNLGVKTIKEILEKIEEYSNMDNIVYDPFTNFNSWMKQTINKEYISKFFESHEIYIRDLEELSVRSYNALRFNNISKMSQLVKLSVKDLQSIDHLGTTSIEEIQKVCNYYIRQYKEEIILRYTYENEQNTVNELINNSLPTEFDDSKAKIELDNIDSKQEDIFKLIKQDEYKEKLHKYIAVNDIPLDKLGLSVRSYNALSNNGFTKLSEFLFMSSFDIKNIDQLGKKSVIEICNVRDDYLKSHEHLIYEYCLGDGNLYSQEYVINIILNKFKTIGFNGLSFREIKELVPEEVSVELVKRAIGNLIHDKELEYVDWRCYKVYPSVFKCLNTEYLSERQARYCELRFTGNTLEEIAQNEGVTRECVRQIIAKAIKSLKSNINTSVFDEDYYEYLYTTYFLEKNVCLEYLKIPESTFYYLFSVYKRGKKDLSDALEDSNLEVSLKLKIQTYLNKDKILLGNTLVKRNRSDIEDYIIRKYCKDDIAFNDFVNLYNQILQDNFIEYDEKIYYSDEILRTRYNRISENRNVLYKQGKTFRYYDIDSQDYNYLLDSINFYGYQNIEISTLKFIESYPDVMEKYDIRDQYELHNLLKKIISDATDKNINFKRMPEIQFGEFDRNEAIMELLYSFAPISGNDLVDLIHYEYGYDPTIIQWTYLQPFSHFVHNNIYSVDFKIMSDENMNLFKSELDEDFYYIDDLKKKYVALIHGADKDEINSYNLKKMGFNVYSKYVLWHQDSLEAYFKYLLLKDDIFDITKYRLKFTYVGQFSSTLMDLRKDYQIMEYEPNQFINMRKLNAIGITKDDILEYCDDVYDSIDINQYFNISSLRKESFSSKLEDLGFDDWFYENLLAMDSRFKYTKISNTMLIYKGNRKQITRQSFIVDLISEYESLDIYDLISDLELDYGINNVEKSDITQWIKDTNIYYDPIMEKLYQEVEQYYSEFDEGDA